MWLRQSTDVALRFGPFLDKTDGVTEETALAPGIEVQKAHFPWASRASATAVTHDSNGWYVIYLNGATDISTLGILKVRAQNAATHLPVWEQYMVVPAPVYDSFIAESDNIIVKSVASPVGLGKNYDTSIVVLSVASPVAVGKNYDSAITVLAVASPVAVGTNHDKTNYTVVSVASPVAVGTSYDKTGYSIASGGIGSGAHAAAEMNAIADAFLDRNMATGTDSGTDSTTTRTVRQALRRMRNKESIAAGTGTVYGEDDSTASWTYAATTTAGNPLSEVDPT